MKWSRTRALAFGLGLAMRALRDAIHKADDWEQGERVRRALLKTRPGR